MLPSTDFGIAVCAIAKSDPAIAATTVTALAVRKARILSDKVLMNIPFYR